MKMNSRLGMVKGGFMVPKKEAAEERAEAKASASTNTRQKTPVGANKPRSAAKGGTAIGKNPTTKSADKLMNSPDKLARGGNKPAPKASGKGS